MAIKDQCTQCKSFDGTNCGLTNALPVYNQRSCENYCKSGINLTKSESGQDSSDDTLGSQNEHQEECSVATRHMFQNPFSFSGRIRRLEYGLSFILYCAYDFMLDIIFGHNTSAHYILLIPAYVWFLSQGTKRCYDRGNTGWYQIIPFYGLWMLFGDGDPHENNYGPDPKGRNITA